MRALGLLTVAVLAIALSAPGATSGTGIDPELFCGTGLDADRLEGKSITRAKRIARRHQCAVRVVRLNGQSLAVTQDYVTNRINVAVRNGTVKRVLGIY